MHTPYLKARTRFFLVGLGRLTRVASRWLLHVIVAWSRMAKGSTDTGLISVRLGTVGLTSSPLVASTTHSDRNVSAPYPCLCMVLCQTTRYSLPEHLSLLSSPPLPGRPRQANRNHEAHIQGGAPSYCHYVYSKTMMLTGPLRQDLKQQKFVIEAEPTETVSPYPA